MDCFLGSGAMFRCEHGGTFIPLTSCEPVFVNINGVHRSVLCNDTPLIGTFGMCAMTPNKPCAITPVPPIWKNPSPIRCCGKNILTQSSYAVCALGGTITPVYGGWHRHIGYDQSFIPRNPPDFHFSEQENNKPSSIQGNARNAPDAPAADSSEKKPVVGNDVSAKQSETEYQQLDSDRRQASFLCKCGGNPAECPSGLYERCRYARADYMRLIPENDPQKLGNNIYRDGSACSSCRTLKKRCSKNIGNAEYPGKKTRTSVKATYHHMVPTGAASGLSSFVRLANFVGYDSNRCSNGICLPMPIDRTNVNRKDNTVYREYIIMRMTGMQIHRTNHGYMLSACEVQRLMQRIHEMQRDVRYSGSEYKAALSYRPEAGKRADDSKTGYNLHIRELLERLTDNIAEKYSGCCYEKEYLNICEDFETGMAYIEDLLRKRITAFRRDPLFSAPYYLSRRILLYAYGLRADDG